MEEQCLESQILKLGNTLKDNIEYLIDRVYADNITGYDKDDIFECFKKFEQELANVKAKLPTL